MKKSRLSNRIQDKLIEHFVAGTTASYAAEIIGVNRKTSAYYFQRLRQVIYLQQSWRHN
jgi:transposase